MRNTWGDRVYQGLLRLLPFDFRSEFGGDMEETFREQRADVAREHGSAALLKMWWSTVADIARMAPREHVSVLAQDCRYALRMMRKNAGYTVAAVLILGLGIGANTSIFSMVNSVLLKPLPYLRGDRLVIVRQKQAKLGIENMRLTPPELEDYRKQNKTLEGLVEFHGMNFTLYNGDEAHRVRTGVVSAGFFDLFGVKPLLGRTFTADDDKPGAQPVLMLSYEFWKQVEHGNPDIVGKTYQMNDRPHIVIGVLPQIPQYPADRDVYMTTTSCPFRSSQQSISSRTAFRGLAVFGRRKPEASTEWCRADLSVVASRLRKDYPNVYPERMGFDATAIDLREELTREAKPMLLVLLGAAGFVLLIACANVANLILARMARREQELVIRTAVGAGGGRLLRQLLTESLIMALLAAGVGVAFATFSVKLLAQFLTPLTPRAREIGVDYWVLGFAVLCAVLTTVVFGSVAAMYARHDIAAGLKEARSSERKRNFARSALIAAQVAFSFVLLIGAGLMVRSFVQLQQVDPGFTPQHVFAVGVNLNFTKFADNAPTLSFARRVLEKVRSQPGVMSVAISNSFPLDQDITGGAGAPRRIEVEGDPRPESESPPITSLRTVSPDYFLTLGIPLVSGRLFTDSDREGAPPVVIINRALARKRFGNEDPIGRRVKLNFVNHWFQVVGVVGDVKEFGLDRDVPYQFYAPLEQEPNPGAVLVRAAGDPAGMTNAVRRLIHGIDPQVAITQVSTLEQARADSVSQPRTLTRLFAVFGALAFAIAVAGIGCMLALWVKQRTREIGIRMALGARPGNIVSAVMRQGMLLVAAGLVVGIVGASALTRFLKALLFHVGPDDVATFAAVSVLFVAAASLACYVPARRASKTDPQEALRCE
jgi:predicted permease